MEDPDQNLYGRAMVPLPGWVTLHSHTNYRSPRQIVDMLTKIGAARQPVEAGSPFKGADTNGKGDGWIPAQAKVCAAAGLVV